MKFGKRYLPVIVILVGIVFITGALIADVIGIGRSSGIGPSQLALILIGSGVTITGLVWFALPNSMIERLHSYVIGEANLERVSSYILLLGSCLVFIVFVVFVWDFTVDDAFISLRYAKNLASGYGLVWNIGEVPIEGYTNFLWVVMTSVSFHAPMIVNPEIFLKIIGILSLIGILLVYFVIFKSVFPQTGNHWLSFAFSAALLFTSPLTAIHVVAGLETVFYSLLLIVFCYSCYVFVIKKKTSNLLFVCLAGFLMSLTRPEGILVTLSLCAALFVVHFHHEKLGIRIKINMVFKFIIILTIFFFLPMSIYAFFKIQYFHDLFPLPFYLKTLSGGSVLPGLGGFKRGLGIMFPYILILPLSIAITFFDNNYATINRVKAITGISLIAILSETIIYLFSTEMMNYASRYYYPGFVIVFLISGMAFGLFVDKLRIQGKKNLAACGRFFLVLITFLLLLADTLFINIGEIPYYRAYAKSQNAVYIPLALSLNRLTRFDITLASVDAGALPYYSGLKHIDIYGLNDRYIAKNDIASLNYVHQLNPDVVILISRDGESPDEGFRQMPFIEFVKANGYIKLFPIKTQQYYLLVYVRPASAYVDQLSTDVRAISFSSFSFYGLPPLESTK